MPQLDLHSLVTLAPTLALLSSFLAFLALELNLRLATAAKALARLTAAPAAGVASAATGEAPRLRAFGADARLRRKTSPSEEFAAFGSAPAPHAGAGAGYCFTTDHKKIGRLYTIFGFFAASFRFFLSGYARHSLRGFAKVFFGARTSFSASSIMLAPETPHLGWSLLIVFLILTAKASLDLALASLRCSPAEGYFWLTSLTPEKPSMSPAPFSPALDYSRELLVAGRVPLEFFWGLLGAGRFGFFISPAPLMGNSLTLPKLLWRLAVDTPFPWYAFYALVLGGGAATVARFLGWAETGGVDGTGRFGSLLWRMPGGVSFFSPGDFFTLTLKVAGESGTAPMRQTLTRKPTRGWALTGQRSNQPVYEKSGPLAFNQVVVKPREIAILLNNKITKGYFCWRPPVNPDSSHFTRLFKPRFLEEAQRLQRVHWENFHQMREGWAGFAYGDGGSHFSVRGEFSLNYSADRRDWRLLRDLAIHLGLSEQSIVSREPSYKESRAGSWRLNVTDKPHVAFAVTLFGPPMHPSAKRDALNRFSQQLMGKPLPEYSRWSAAPFSNPTHYILGCVVSDGHAALQLNAKTGQLNYIRVDMSSANEADLRLFEQQLGGGSVKPKNQLDLTRGYRWCIGSRSGVKKIARLALTPGQPLGAKSILCLSQASLLFKLNAEKAFLEQHPKHSEWKQRLHCWKLYSALRYEPFAAGEWEPWVKTTEWKSALKGKNYYPLSNYGVIRRTPWGRVSRKLQKNKRARYNLNLVLSVNL